MNLWRGKEFVMRIYLRKADGGNHLWISSQYGINDFLFYKLGRNSISDSRHAADIAASWCAMQWSDANDTPIIWIRHKLALSSWKLYSIYILWEQGMILYRFYSIIIHFLWLLEQNEIYVLKRIKKNTDNQEKH